MKRVVFNNLVLKLKDNQYLLMNLRSFRRISITGEILETIIRIENKIKASINLTSEESLVYDSLLINKQILGQELIEKYDQEVEKKYHIKDAKINTITFNISYKCNFNCSYCYQKRYDSRNQVMTKADVYQINNYLNEQSNADIKQIIISGGEPLLSENIETLNTILKLFNNDTTKFMLFTNGVNIIKYKDRIDFSKIAEFQISFDGVNDVIEKVNNYHKSAFETIASGIKYLAEQNKKITIISMLTEELVNNLEQFIAEIENAALFNYQNITFRISTITNRVNDDTLDHNFYTLREYLELRKKVKAKIEGKPIYLDTIYDFSWLASSISRDINKKQAGRVNRCSVEANIPLLFGPGGKVYWCGCQNIDIGIVGNYYQNTLIESQLIDYQKRSIFSLEKCKTCDYKYLCAGGCPLNLVVQEKAVSEPICGAYGNSECLEHLEEIIM